MGKGNGQRWVTGGAAGSLYRPTRSEVTDAQGSPSESFRVRQRNRPVAGHVRDKLDAPPAQTGATRVRNALRSASPHIAVHLDRSRGIARTRCRDFLPTLKKDNRPVSARNATQPRGGAVGLDQDRSEDYDKRPDRGV